MEVQILRHGLSTYQKLGTSEVIWKNASPNFTQAFVVDFRFEEQLRVRFVVLQVRDRSGDLRGAEIVGTADISLHEIVTNQGQFRKPLDAGTHRQPGWVVVRAEEIQTGRDIAKMKFVGKKLEVRTSFLHSVLPYLTISRSMEPGDYQVVHRTVKSSGREPAWPAYEVPVQHLCNNDKDRPFRLEVLDDWDKGIVESVGVADTSLAEIVEGNRRQFPLVSPEKRANRGYANSGVLELEAFEVVKQYEFLDYIVGGCEISLVVAIDFTSSNLDPRHPSSLHYLNPQGFNDYEKALLSVGGILLNYDSDKQVPVYGFGDKVNRRVNHCFPLTFSDNPNVNDLNGLMQVYREALVKVELSGPTLLGPVLQTVVPMAEAEQDSQDHQHYYVLLVLTDGTISDEQMAVDLIVRGSFAPLSIVIVGLGNDEFRSMERLDADEEPLVDSHGKVMDRDIVQFVSFRAINTSAAELSRQVLAEIPRELVNYFSKRGIVPNPRKPRPELGSPRAYVPEATSPRFPQEPLLPFHSLAIPPAQHSTFPVRQSFPAGTPVQYSAQDGTPSPQPSSNPLSYKIGAHLIRNALNPASPPPPP